MARYREGYNATHLCGEFGLAPSTITSIRRRHGITRRRRHLNPALNVPADPAVPAYLAGLIDGEGTIRRWRGRARHPHSRRESADIQIVNTDRHLMDWLANIGGTVYWARRDHPEWKPIGTWKVTQGVDVARFLESVIPYMTVKKDLAETTLAEVKERLGLA